MERFELDNMMRKGWRIYKSPEGFILTDTKAKYFYNRLGLIIEMDETRGLIRLKDARQSSL